MRGEALARQVGTRQIQPYHISIARPKGTVRCSDGVRRNGISPPFMPKTLADEFHPGGNSLCYAIQLAFLMGADPIYLLGFTLKSGSGYFFGDLNPVTKRKNVYDERRALDWLTWFESKWPGRAKLVEGFDGPLRDVLQTESCDALLDRNRRDPTEEWLL